MPGVVLSAVGVSLTALTECIHSDAAIPLGRKCFLLMMGRVTGSIYSADPGVDRHHLISILSYDTMKVQTLFFPTFGLTHSVRNFVDVRNCVDPQCWVVSYLLNRFLRSSNQNRCLPWIQIGCHGRCGGELMLGSLPSSFIVSPQRPPSCASLNSLNGLVQVLLRLWSSTICRQIDRMHIERLK